MREELGGSLRLAVTKEKEKKLRDRITLGKCCCCGVVVVLLWCCCVLWCCCGVVVAASDASADAAAVGGYKDIFSFLMSSPKYLPKVRFL